MNKSKRTTNIFLKNYVKKARQTYCQSILKDCQNDVTPTWQKMKEITGKSKVNSSKFPKSINVNGKSMKENSLIAEEFNKYLTTVGPNLACNIQKKSKTFEDFLFPAQKNMEYRYLTFEEF